MATKTANAQLTLTELANRLDPKGELNTIVEVLAENNEWLMDAVWIEANNTFSNQATRRLSLPSGTWRKLNAGVPNEASQTEPITDVIGMLETYAEVDKELADAAPSPKQFRMDEAVAFLEGLAHTLAATFIYGNATVDTEKFHGLAPRMATLDADGLVVGEGGTGADLTSVFLVQWGPTLTHMLYPRNSMLGIQHKDLGEVTLEDSSGNKYQGYRDHFQVKAGMANKDPKSIARLANIESDGVTNGFDEDNIIRMKNRLRNGGRGAIFYCNSDVKTQAEIALKDKANVFYSAAAGEGLFGEDVTKAKQMPIRMVDQILSTESALT